MTATDTAELEKKRSRLRNWILDVEPEAATQGINHVAVFAKDLEVTAAFYSEVMGMPVVGVTPNRDAPGSTHMNVAIGNGMTFSFFDFPYVPRLRRRAPEGARGSGRDNAHCPAYRAQAFGRDQGSPAKTPCEVSRDWWRSLLQRPQRTGHRADASRVIRGAFVSAFEHAMALQNPGQLGHAVVDGLGRRMAET